MTIGTGSAGPGPGAGEADDIRSRIGEHEATQGGLVTETGIALVERGEIIVPRAGSDAQVELARMEVGTEVHIHLPVVVEMVGRSDDLEAVRTADETLRRLRLAIEAQPMDV